MGKNTLIRPLILYVAESVYKLLRCLLITPENPGVYNAVKGIGNGAVSIVCIDVLSRIFGNQDLQIGVQNDILVSGSVKHVSDVPDGQAEFEKQTGGSRLVVLKFCDMALLRETVPHAAQLKGQHLVLRLKIAEIGRTAHIRFGRHFFYADFLNRLLLH